MLLERTCIYLVLFIKISKRGRLNFCQKALYISIKFKRVLAGFVDYLASFYKNYLFIYLIFFKVLQSTKTVDHLKR